MRKSRKQDQNLKPGELLQIPLSLEVVRRYVEMRRKKRIETDRTTVYCPRKWCQGPAKSKRHPTQDFNTTLWANYASDSGDDDDSETAPNQPSMEIVEKGPPYKAGERLAQCEGCSYAFCRVCKQGWHGDHEQCWPRNRAELTEEERATLNFLRENTAACPTCSAPCVKTAGCNHMRCPQCQTHFCYLCSSWIDNQNPYLHFSTKGRGCYNRLWSRGKYQEEVEADPNELGLEEAHEIAAPHVRGQGIQRFLQMVQADREDEWDSDELEDGGEVANMVD